MSTNGVRKSYSQIKPKYDKFAGLVGDILFEIVQANGIFSQSISSRGKTVESLVDKCTKLLSLKKQIDKKGVGIVDDLAGARIILYLYSDITRVISLICDEFGRENVVENRYKFSEDGYNAHHLVIKLDENRLKLSEYKNYAGLKCEIQVTTVLYHAWNEISHETLYKLTDDDKKDFETQYKSVDDQLKQIMENHIEPAQLELQTTYENFLAIKQGRPIFSQLYLDQIKASRTLEDLHSKLSILESSVRNYGNKFPSSVNLVEQLQNIINESKQIKPETIKTPLGDIPGKTHDSIISKYLEILKLLIYQYPEQVISILFDISKKKDDQATKILEDFAEYNIHFLKKHGFYCQLNLLSFIEKKKPEELNAKLHAVQSILAKILSASYEGTEMIDYRTLQMSMAGLGVSDNLKLIRDRALEILFNLFKFQLVLPDKLQTIKTIYSAMVTPHQGGSDDLDNLIIQNANKIINFYIVEVAVQDFEAINEIEEELFFVTEQHFTLDNFPKINEFKALLENNQEYQIFKLFYGYQRRFKKSMGFKKDEKERKSEIAKLLNEVDPKTYVLWEERLLTFGKNLNNTSDSGLYNYLFHFLNELATQHPVLGWKLLSNQKVDHINWKLNIISGLWKNTDHKIIRTQALEWIQAGKDLEVITYLFQNLGWDYEKSKRKGTEIDLNLLKKLFESITKSKKTKPFVKNILGCLLYYPKTTDANKLFFDCIKELTIIKSTAWLSHWYKLESYLSGLSESEAQVILDNLLYEQDLDFHQEEILAVIAEHYPLKIVELFEKRVKRKISLNKKDRFSRYDPIPYRIDNPKLLKYLQASESEVITAITKWFDKSEGFYKWEGSHLIYKLFGFSEAVKQHVLGLINQKTEASAKRALEILETYEGDGDRVSDQMSAIIELSIEFVKSYSQENLLSRLESVFIQTGVVSGEFGLSDAYNRKREVIKPLMQHTDPKIIKFFTVLDKQLEAMSISEKKRSKLEIERMKKGLE